MHSRAHAFLMHPLAASSLAIWKPGLATTRTSSQLSAIFQFLAPKNYSGVLGPIWVRRCKLHFPLSFGKSYMKICSAVPENVS